VEHVAGIEDYQVHSPPTALPANAGLAPPSLPPRGRWIVPSGFQYAQGDGVPRPQGIMGRPCDHHRRSFHRIHSHLLRRRSHLLPRCSHLLRRHHRAQRRRSRWQSFLMPRQQRGPRFCAT
jgi:hypothetical protein